MSESKKGVRTSSESHCPSAGADKAMVAHNEGGKVHD